YHAQQIALKGIIFSGQTPYQQVEIIETIPFGRCLVLDGKMQSSQSDEFIYHETLVHPPLTLHPDPKSVLIIGGGEGATLREVLRHRSVAKVTMLDIDRDIVELCRQHLPDWHQGSFDDARVELHFADARAFLAQSQVSFDIILSDITDPIEGGPSYLLYTREFYQLVHSRLNPGGILAVQAGPARWPLDRTFPAIYHTLSQVFPSLLPYSTEVPSFGGGWGFILAGHDLPHLIPEEIDLRLGQKLTNRPRFYDGLTHQRISSLSLPLRQGLENGKLIISDAQPYFVY
ncbi:MAG: fused MFS/spermidine synthase, partial [Chloroflexota bacterium]